MGNTASCRAGTVVNARQARGAHAETLMIPTHASTAIRSLVHAIGYGDLKNIAQCHKRAVSARKEAQLKLVASPAWMSNRELDNLADEVETCILWMAEVLVRRCESRAFSKYMRHCTPPMQLGAYTSANQLLEAALQNGQPADMKRAVQEARSLPLARPRGAADIGPRARVSALLWGCGVAADRLLDGELAAAGGEGDEERATHVLECLLRRTYPDTMAPIETFAQWLAALVQGVQLVQEPPFSELACLQPLDAEPEQADQLAQDATSLRSMLRVAKLEVYMLSACLEISTGTASSARLLSTFRTLRRVVQEGAALQGVDESLVEWAQGLLERADLEAKMMSAIEANDAAAAERVLAAVGPKQESLGVMAELVERAQAMVRRVAQEEAHLLQELKNVVGRLDSMGRPIAHLSDWRAALLSAKARAMDTPTSGGLTFVERNMEELPGLLAAIDAHVDVIRQIEGIRTPVRGSGPLHNTHSASQLLLCAPESALTAVPSSLKKLEPLLHRPSVDLTMDNSVAKQGLADDQGGGGEGVGMELAVVREATPSALTTISANATFLTASLKNYTAKGVAVLPSLVAHAEQHIEKTLLEARLRRACADGNVHAGAKVLKEVLSSSAEVDAELVRATQRMVHEHERDTLSRTSEAAAIRGDLRGVVQGKLLGMHLRHGTATQHLAALASAVRAARALPASETHDSTREELAVAETQMQLIRDIQAATKVVGLLSDEQDKRAAIAHLKAALDGLSPEMKQHPHNQEAVEHVRAVVRKMGLEAPLCAMVAMAGTGKRHSSKEVRRAVEAAAGMADEQLVQRCKQVLQGAETEEQLLRCIDSKDEDGLYKVLGRMKKSGVGDVRDVVIQDAQAVLLTLRALSLCREAAASDHAPTLEAALNDAQVLRLLEDAVVSHSHVGEALVELKELQLKLQQLRAAEAVRAALDPLDVPALQAAVVLARTHGLEDPVVGAAEEMLASLSRVQLRGEFAPSGGPYSAPATWTSNPQYKVSFALGCPEVAKLAVVVMDETTSLEDHKAVMGQHPGLEMLKNLEASNPASKSDEPQSKTEGPSGVHAQAEARGALGEYAVHAYVNMPGVSTHKVDPKKGHLLGATPYSRRTAVLRLDHVDTSKPLFLVPSTAQQGVYGVFILSVVSESLGVAIQCRHVIDSSLQILQAINKGDVLELERLLGPGGEALKEDGVNAAAIQLGVAYLAKRRVEARLATLLAGHTTISLLEAALYDCKGKDVDLQLLARAEEKLTHLKAEASLKEAAQRGDLQALSAAIDHARAIGLHQEIVAGFVWHRRHIAAKIRLKEVLDAQQEGYQVLQPAYDEALAAGVKNEHMDKAIDILDMLSNRRRAVEVHFEAWNTGLPEDNPPTSTGVSWLDNPQVMIEVGDALGLLGATSVEASLTVSGAVGSGEMAAGTFQKDFQVMVLSPSNPDTVWSQAMFPHRVVHESEVDTLPKVIRLSVSPKQQFVVVLCTNDTSNLAAGSSLRVQCSLVAKYTMKYIATVQARINDVMNKTHHFTKLASLLHEANEVNVGLHWMVESARLVHNMHVASHDDDQAKTDTLTEAISQAIEAIPPLQIPSFPLIHFNRMRKHTVIETLLKKAADNLDHPLRHAMLLAGLQYAKVVAHDSKLFQQALRTVELAEYSIDSRVTCFKYHLAAGPKSAGMWRHNPALRVVGLPPKKKSVLYIAVSEGGGVYNEEERDWVRQLDEWYAAELAYAKGRVALAQSRLSIAIQNDVEHKKHPEIWRAVRQAELRVEVLENEKAARQRSREARQAGLRAGKLMSRFAGLSVALVKNSSSSSAWRIPGVDPKHDVVAVSKRRPDEINYLAVEVKPSDGPFYIMPWSSEPGEEDTMTVSVMVRNAKELKLEHVPHWDGWKIFIQGTWSDSNVAKGPRMLEKHRSETQPFVNRPVFDPESTMGDPAANTLLMDPEEELMYENQDAEDKRDEDGTDQLEADDSSQLASSLRCKDTPLTPKSSRKQLSKSASRNGSSSTLLSMLPPDAAVGVRAAKRVDQAGDKAGAEDDQLRDDDIPMQPRGPVQANWGNNPQFRLWLAPDTHVPGKHKWIKANVRIGLSTVIKDAQPALHIVRNKLVSKFDPFEEVMAPRLQSVIAEAVDNYTKQPEIVLECQIHVAVATYHDLCDRGRNYCRAEHPFFIVPSLEDPLATGDFTLAVHSDVPLTIEVVEDHERHMKEDELLAVMMQNRSDQLIKEAAIKEGRIEAARQQAEADKKMRGLKSSRSSRSKSPRPMGSSQGTPLNSSRIGSPTKRSTSAKKAPRSRGGSSGSIVRTIDF